MSERRIGVYICHCGGNISDYVDVAEVRDAVADEPGVVHAETTMFACSDGSQHDMIRKIQEERLDGLVVASCSPKLHLFTFRGVARRAGLNPFQYTQVNIREQDSWAHGDDPVGATRKAIGLVRAGVAKTRASVPLEPIGVETTGRALVVGGGIAGLRAAIGLADIGLGVTLVERKAELGGWAGRFGPMFPHERAGRDLVASLVAEVRKRPTITTFTRAELVGKSGSFGNYRVELRVAPPDDGAPETVGMEVGAIVIATGFDTYQPEAGEYGYGIEGVLTLAEFKELVDASPGPLRYKDQPIGTVAYIYCVGNRQEGGNAYCSKYCCSAAVHESIQVSRHDVNARQYHLYRDIRTYGRYELMYEESRERGSVYMKFPDDRPPSVERGGDGKLLVTTVDVLTGGEKVSLEADLVVLVTGMVPRQNADLTGLLKLPLGSDGFFNEIHPKLRPVETVVDGVMIAGACQGPKTSSESVASSLAAVTQCGAMLMRGTAELDPLVATVDADVCTGCGECEEACPYSAIRKVTTGEREVIAIDATACKGCGGCAPYCPEDAIDLLGSTDEQIRGMIDNLLETSAA